MRKILDATRKIGWFVDKMIKQKEMALLEMLCILHYSLEGKGYGNCADPNLFKKWFGRVCARNLQRKYGLDLEAIAGNLSLFNAFLITVPELFKADEPFKTLKVRRMLGNMLLNKGSQLSIDRVKMELKALTRRDKRILTFTANYMAMKLSPFKKLTELDKYDWDKDFKPVMSAPAGHHVAYFAIDFELWTKMFNYVFGESLTGQRFYVEGNDPARLQRIWDEYSFWELGDALIRMGIGYWIVNTEEGKKGGMEFIIPEFIYSEIKRHKTYIKDFKTKVAEIESEEESERFEETWGLEEIKGLSDVSEYELERSILADPERLEKGLKLIDSLYRLPLNPADMVCKDKKGNFVVVLFKKKMSSDTVEGKIQSYMAGIEENLADGKEVRGIIVVRDYDRDLRRAVKGSRFRIDIKRFKETPLDKKRVRFCEFCGAMNIKPALFCGECGEELL